MTADSTLLRGNPILAKFRAALYEMYGARLERLVLFGSQARGDAHPDSDYDVAVFLNGSEKTFNRWAELDKLAALRVKFLDETGVFFDAKPYPATEYRERSPLMHEIRREGLDL
jgi:predicted nucleotidyltransferase